mmetsp:Transcript_100527/g.199685  ORF Transcript_100527/g.199685 Transcript_100527/m.199685 type:complete len:147 (+) Transcript_100527:1708-2148(+)
MGPGPAAAAGTVDVSVGVTVAVGATIMPLAGVQPWAPPFGGESARGDVNAPAGRVGNIIGGTAALPEGGNTTRLLARGWRAPEKLVPCDIMDVTAVAVVAAAVLVLEAIIGTLPLTVGTAAVAPPGAAAAVAVAPLQLAVVTFVAV